MISYLLIYIIVFTNCTISLMTPVIIEQQVHLKTKQEIHLSDGLINQ